MYWEVLNYDVLNDINKVGQIMHYTTFCCTFFEHGRIKTVPFHLSC